MDNLKIRLIKNKRELNQILKIRETVFIKGQGVPKRREIDGLDRNSKHAIVLYKNKPIGCARIRIIHKKAKLERIALLNKYRGKGFGKLMMGYLVDYCKRKNVSEIVVHSQCYIKEFYRKYGFKERGKVFMDANIKHIAMHYPTTPLSSK